MLGKCDEVKVEGYEANVILGAEKVLRQAGAYLVQDFNPSFYICNNQVDRYLKIMNKIYDNFAELGNDGIHDSEDISELASFLYSCKQQTNLIF